MPFAQQINAPGKPVIIALGSIEMNISIDSNSLTYLIQAIDPSYDPLKDKEAVFLQRASMLRIFLYGGLRCAILPQVIKEIGDIPNYEWKDIHESTIGILFHEVAQNYSESDLVNRKEKLLEKHPKEKDCSLLAEAEFYGINVLLTRDKKFRNRLNPISDVEIIFPSDYFQLLNVDQNSEPIFSPHKTNPLFGKTWWKI